MTNFKIKFSTFEGFIAFQILNQSDSFRCTSLTSGIKQFVSPNGSVTITSSDHPSLSIKYCDRYKNKMDIQFNVGGTNKSLDSNLYTVKVPNELIGNESNIVNMIIDSLYELNSELFTSKRSISGDLVELASCTYRLSKFSRSLVFVVEKVNTEIDRNFEFNTDEISIRVSDDCQPRLIFGADKIMYLTLGFYEDITPDVVNFNSIEERDSYADLINNTMLDIDAKLFNKSDNKQVLQSNLGDIVVEI